MSRIVPVLMLVVGVAIAAASGARNGPSHTDWRAASWLVDELSGVPADGPERDEAVAALVERGVLQQGERPEDALQRAIDAREAGGRPLPSDRIVQWAGVGGPAWFAGVGLIVAGAVLARRRIAAENRGEGGEDGGQVDFAATLGALRGAVDALREQAAELPMDDDAPALRSEIDRLLIEVMGPVVEARGQLQARHGVGPFAEYFGPFAGAERYLARAWSGLTDGHAEMARSALAAASTQLELAEKAWERAEQGTEAPRAA